MNRLRDGTPLHVVRAFIRAINGGRLDRIETFLTADHVFIDSLGSRVIGRDATRSAWAGYLRLVSDYRIRATQVMAERNTVVVFGIASGSYRAPDTRRVAGRWQTPAAWRAVVRRQRVTTWQVYADNEPIRALMRTHALQAVP